LQNHPNPFNHTTEIRFSLPEPKEIELTLHDLLGNVIEVLAEGFHRSGTYTVQLSARNLSNGVYFYKLQISPGLVLTGKMVVMK
jgi:hypothetical protein